MRKLLAVSLLLIPACETPSGTPAPPTAPGLIEVLEGDAQTGEAGEELEGALAVRVTDEAGIPVSQAVISWRGDGTPLAAVTSTDRSGIAQNRWILGTKAGADTLQARWINPRTVDARVLATFTATARPGAPAVGLLVEDCELFGISADTLRPLGPPIRDQYGNSITDWKFRPFPTSTGYGVLPDSQGIVAAAATSGVDSVQVVAAGAVLRITHVYVRHPQIATTLMVINWRRRDGVYDCGTRVPYPRP